MTAIVNEGTSGPGFLRRTVWIALWTGIVVALATAYRWGWEFGSGMVTALLWALANFLVLAAILKAATRPGGADKAAVATLMALKVVGLYGLLFLILWKRWFPLPAFLVGFSWPLLIILLRALGAMWWEKAKAA